jgi:hypothetical protein
MQKKKQLGITDLSQYAMAFNTNVPLDEALFESRIMPKIIEQLRELIEDSVQRIVDRALGYRKEF